MFTSLFDFPVMMKTCALHGERGYVSPLQYPSPTQRCDYFKLAKSSLPAASAVRMPYLLPLRPVTYHCAPEKGTTGLQTEFCAPSVCHILGVYIRSIRSVYILFLRYFAFGCGRSVETRDFGGFGRGGIRGCQVGPAGRQLYDQVQFRGPRSRWDKVGVRLECHRGAE